MAPGPDETSRAKTVVLPNPGGRRTAPPQPNGAPPGAPPADVWGDTTPATTPPPAAPPSPPGGPAATVTAEDYEALPAAAGALLGSQAALNDNAMLQSAAPLLLMLARLRAGIVRAHSAEIMDKVAAFVERFERDVAVAGFSAEQARVAKYALCATADDVVQNIPVDDRRVWTQHSMLSRFFGERIGGVRFFEELKRMKADPLANVSVLELMFACLAVGFEGVYRTAPNGLAELQGVQRDLYDTIRRVRPRETAELSPRWQGTEIAPRDVRNRIPVWALAAFGLALVCGVFLLYRSLLIDDAQAVSNELLALHPLTPVVITRPPYEPMPEPVAAPEPEPEPEPVVVEAPPEPQEPPPPPPPTPAERIAEVLAGELGAGYALLDASGDDIIITVGDLEGRVLFRSARATLSDDYLPVIRRIGAAIASVFDDARVRVVGHTDTLPINTVRFPDNFALSQARAETVAGVLAEEIGDPDRVEAVGRGATSPLVTPERTAADRARNRRVDIIIRTEP